MQDLKDTLPREGKDFKVATFDDGYLEGKDAAKFDLKNRKVNITSLRLKRNVSDKYGIGYEIGYLRQLLWTLTEGKIT